MFSNAVKIILVYQKASRTLQFYTEIKHNTPTYYFLRFSVKPTTSTNQWNVFHFGRKSFPYLYNNRLSNKQTNKQTRSQHADSSEVNSHNQLLFQELNSVFIILKTEHLEIKYFSIIMVFIGQKTYYAHFKTET